MVEVSTSILNIKKEDLPSVCMGLEIAKTDYFHIDVMDGKFVEKNTYEKMIECSTYIKRLSNIPLDIHLMVEDVKAAVNDFLAFEPNVITFHLESIKIKKNGNEDKKNKVIEMIRYIRENNCKVGLSIKPNTKISEIYEFLPYINMCLIMTVEPGKGGQTFLGDMLEKIKLLKEYTKKNNIDIDIEVDGGINLNNANKVKEAGANVLVAGTAILAAKDYKVIIDEMKK